MAQFFFWNFEFYKFYVFFGLCKVAIFLENSQKLHLDTIVMNRFFSITEQVLKSLSTRSKKWFGRFFDISKFYAIFDFKICQMTSWHLTDFNQIKYVSLFSHEALDATSLFEDFLNLQIFDIFGLWKLAAFPQNSQNFILTPKLLTNSSQIMHASLLGQWALDDTSYFDKIWKF